MSLSHLLPDFGTPLPSLGGGAESDEDVEALKLEAFEAGYKAGWDDSVKAQNEEASHVAAELARTLQDASFTYHEARSQILAALRPLLTQLVDIVLPDLARATLAERVAGEIAALADTLTAAEVRVHAAPDSVPALERLADRVAGAQLTVAADATLGPGQVLLKVAETERQIDLDELLDGIRSAVTGYLEQNLQEVAHG